MCDYKASATKCLDKHLKRIHNSFVLYSCEQCDKTFQLRNSLKRHVKRNHKGIDYKMFSCNKCDFKTQLSKRLVRHMQHIHEGFKYSCNQCEEIFKNQIPLNQHKKKHDKKYACADCNYIGLSENCLLYTSPRPRDS